MTSVISFSLYRTSDFDEDIHSTEERASPGGLWEDVPKMELAYDMLNLLRVLKRINSLNFSIVSVCGNDFIENFGNNELFIQMNE